MRKQTKYIRIAITEETHKRLTEDKNHFQKIIGGGKWSYDDTIKEYHKIINT